MHLVYTVTRSKQSLEDNLFNLDFKTFHPMLEKIKANLWLRSFRNSTSFLFAVPVNVKGKFLKILKAE